MVYQTCSTHILPDRAQKNCPTLPMIMVVKIAKVKWKTSSWVKIEEKKTCKRDTDIGETYGLGDDDADM